jgi:signal transduction histidine kinase
MSAAQVQRLQAFRQFDRPRFEQQGLGLGLTLVCKLLLQHGGYLGLDSQPGEGTLCRVELPRADLVPLSP